MNKNILSHLALLGATTFYALTFIIAKDVMPDYVAPYGFIVIRVVGAGLLFWLLGLFVNEKIDKKDYSKLVLGAFFGVALNQMLFFKGLSYTTPLYGSIIMVSNPIIVLIVASILLKERITSRKIVGIVLGAFGALSLILYGKEVGVDAPDTVLGNILVLINAASYGVYLVIMQPLMRKYHPLTIIKWVFLIGFVFVIPFGFKEFTEIKWMELPSEMIWRIAYVVIFTSFFAYLLNVYALRKLKASTVSFYIYLQPIIISILTIILGRDTIGLIEVLSSASIFYGVYLVSTKQTSK